MKENVNILRDPATYQVLKSPGNSDSEHREIRSCESDHRGLLPADERDVNRPLSMGFGAILMRPRSSRSRR